MDKVSTDLGLRSPDLIAEKRAKLLQLFPEIQDEAGQVDLERLKVVLGDQRNVGKERYSLTWPGKADCFKQVQAASLSTLLPAPAESIAFDSSENLIIEGDNLEVLKLLQKAYANQAKLIYIDPPYNTGREFIYEDDYRDPVRTYLSYTAQLDEQGRKYSTNSETDGRFHSTWLNMMYPRLYLARNLLREDGVIIISIDDGEFSNLRKICDEIFGEDNFVSTFVWNSSTAGGIRPKHVSQCHEYAVMYANDKEALGELFAPLSPEAVKQYVKADERGPYREKDFAWRNASTNENQRYGIQAPDGSFLFPGPGYIYRFVRESFEQAKRAGLVVFKETQTSPLVEQTGQQAKYNIYIKKHLGKAEGAPASIPPRSLVGLSSRGSEEIKALFDGELVFTNPKSTDYLQYLFLAGLEDTESPLVIDFFAGSGTTAHTILELNRQDGGNRKFILVQLPEATGRSDYPTIAEITKDRVRRVIRQLNAADTESPPSGLTHPDRGFRVFKLAESNFQPWQASVAKNGTALAHQLNLYVNHIRYGRHDQDLLYELLLKSGFPLTTSIESLIVEGKQVYRVAAGALMICLEHALTLPLIRSLAAMQPQRVVCLDEGFAGNDQLKANAAAIFKSADVINFKTV